MICLESISFNFWGAKIRSQIFYLHIVKFGRVLPIKCQCCPHIETSQLICWANQLTGFYMRATLALNGLKTGTFSISKGGDDISS